MPRDGRSEAQPERVQASRDDDCIKLKAKWAALEALMGMPKRIDLVAAGSRHGTCSLPEFLRMIYT